MFYSLKLSKDTLFIAKSALWDKKTRAYTGDSITDLFLELAGKAAEACLLVE